MTFGSFYLGPLIMLRVALVLLCLAFGSICGSARAAFDEELHAAIREGDVQTVRSKLTKGVDLEPACRPNLNCKPLVYAAALARRQIVEMLVEAGADLNSTSPVGDTALIKSLIVVERNQGDAEMAKYLIAKGADVNKPNLFGISAFIGACALGELELVNLMLAHGAIIDSAFRNQISPDPPEPGARNTCLHMAAMEGHVEIARLMLRGGADPKLKNSIGRTPKDYADQAGRKDLVDLLSSHTPRP
jgi:ankyrin repeat protein